MRPEDHAFVLDSWLLSDRYSAAARDEGVGYMRRQKARIRGILARATTVGTVACGKDDDDAIVGWSVTCPRMRVVYYVFVRPEVRRQGLGTLLLGRGLRLANDRPLAETACTFTHRPVVRGIMTPTNWIYDRAALYCEEATAA